MEVLNRNQRAAALWRLSGLYAATIVIMGILIFQSLKAYGSRVDKATIDAAVQKAVKQTEKNFMDAVKQINTSAVQEVQKASSSVSNNSNSIQAGLNDANGKLMQAKAVQTTAKSIENLTKDLNPMKK
jgi:hypothetical protein